MAQKSTPVVLNIGSQRVALANIVGGSKGNLALTKYHTREMGGDAASDASRLPLVRMAVQELVGESKSKGSAVRYSVPGHPVFMRFVKLPPLSEDKVGQIVEFEAQQNVPFPLDEVSWAYQLIGEPGSGDVEVLLAAMKSDELGQYNSAVTGPGVQTLSVDVAPMLLYNAYRYNYPDQTNSALIIDIGARTTNLIYAEQGKVFINSTRIGGANITQAIAKELEIPFEDAEQLKLQKGYCSLGGNYQEPTTDPQGIQLGGIIRNTITRLHGEIVRTNTRYKTQQGGNLPQIAYLAGRTSGTPYLLEFLKEKLGIPVEYFNALRNVSVGPKVDQDKIGAEAHAMGELVGLALRNGEGSPLEVELVPPSVAQARDLDKRKPALIMAAVGLLSTLGAGAFYYSRGAEVVTGKINEQQKTVSHLEGIQNSIENSRKELKSATAETAPYVDAMNKRGFWLDFLNDLNQRIKDNKEVWFTVMEPLSEDKAIFNVDLVDVAGQGGGAGSTNLGIRKRLPSPNEDELKSAKTQKRKANVLVDKIRLRGLFRHPATPTAINEKLFSELRSSPYFKFEGADKDSPVEVNAFVQADDGTDQSVWAWPFTITCPLKTPIVIKSVDLTGK